MKSLSVHSERIIDLRSTTRPATLTFTALPKFLQSSPDGSCLLTAEDRPSQTPGISLLAFHIASFGSSPGISLDITELEVPAACLAVTSFTNKSRCHLIGLDTSRLLLESTALQISHKNTEFMFQTRGQDIKKKTASPKTAGSHNCLIDCHRDVWTRFPVDPAVRRQTVTSSLRRPRSLTFVSKLPSSLYARHFSELVFAFENSERKPVGSELADIQVSGTMFEGMIHGETADRVTVVRGGEWLVEILCLIPIQIAITRKNGFYPVQDGIWSQDFEHSILGATVEQVIDSLSFGWYESIFESYMALKVSETAVAPEVANKPLSR